MLRRPEESEEEDDEDETAELLRELEKIKRERAEEKERQVDKFVQPIVFLSDDFQGARSKCQNCRGTCCGNSYGQSVA